MFNEQSLLRPKNSIMSLSWCYRGPIVLLLLVLPVSVQDVYGRDKFDLDVPYQTRLRNFRTKLVKKGPAPRHPKEQTPLPGVHVITYPSGKRKLKAWVKKPPNSNAQKYPAVVYFHSDFAFTANHFKTCRPFLAAGYVVMTPMLRGENGNPGDCEMFLGEVDDAIAAVNWLARQKIVDRRRIYTFGHSAGGVVSAMLSLRKDVPIRYGGSSGGLYGPLLFTMIKDRVPFDLTNPVEREMRVLPPNVRWMQRRHVAYIGTEDAGVKSGVERAKKEIAKLDKPMLSIVEHSGKHSSALAPAVKQFVELLKANP